MDAACLFRKLTLTDTTLAPSLKDFEELAKRDFENAFLFTEHSKSFFHILRMIFNSFHGEDMDCYGPREKKRVRELVNEFEEESDYVHKRINKDMFQ